MNLEAVELATHVIFGPRHIHGDDDVSVADAKRDALKNWAASFVAEDAQRYFLNSDLRALVYITVQAALFVSIRRALEKLPSRMPTGEHGLRNDDERQQWLAFASEWGRLHQSKAAIMKFIEASVRKTLGAGWNGSPGRASSIGRDKKIRNYRDARQVHHRTEGKRDWKSRAYQDTLKKFGLTEAEFKGAIKRANKADRE